MSESTEATAAEQQAAASGEAAAASSNGAPGIPVENPATGEIIATVPDLGAAAVAEIVADARRAQPAWEALGFEGRAKYFHRAQKAVIDNQDRIVEAIVSETGKTHEDAILAEIGYVAAAFGFWPKLAPKWLAERKVRSSSIFVKGKKLVIRYRPVGVVGVIGPWNFPLTNSFGDCIPALVAGNAAVLKPSEVTPLTSQVMAEVLDGVGFPEHVFQVATGRGETGAALIDNVDFIQFTGSTATGRKVMIRAAENLTPIGLELGGNDPMIVLADADLERAANAAVYYAMNNAGQVCISVERAYVEEPVYDEFVAKVTEKARRVRQGSPAGGPGSVDIGAVIHPPQLDIVDRQVKDAVAKGAKVVVGGEAGPGPGHFYKPTVLIDVDQSMAIMREETFGPTLPVMKVRDAEQAVRLANDSEYGLQASVWTKDIDRGEQIAKRIEAGAICVNDAQINYTALELPMGGWKSSGLGVRHGAAGIRKFTAVQTVLVTRFALRRDPHMFPYSARTTRMLAKLIALLHGRGKRDGTGPAGR